MRRGLLLSIPVAILLMAGCASKPQSGECKSSDDCKDQQGYGKVCVEGRCQECGADTDCQSGFVCRQNKCAPRPECSQDADCGSGRACQDGRCIASSKPECSQDADCGSGMGCDGGRCVSKMSAANAAAACGGDQNAVRFALDKSELDAESRATLDRVASCLKNVRGVNLVVEGHCDERGTTEYNLHLGERRAESVRKYLVNLGLDAATIKATSYGEERPLCNEANEGCWSRNRRALVSAEGADRS